MSLTSFRITKLTLDTRRVRRLVTVLGPLHIFVFISHASCISVHLPWDIDGSLVILHRDLINRNFGGKYKYPREASGDGFSKKQSHHSPCALPFLFSQRVCHYLWNYAQPHTDTVDVGWMKITLTSWNGVLYINKLHYFYKNELFWKIGNIST